MVRSVPTSSTRAKHSDDRFYSPPQRRQLQQQQQPYKQQQQKIKDQFQEIQIPVVPVSTHIDVRTVDSHLGFPISYYPFHTSLPRMPKVLGRNLDCFIHSITPSVPARKISKRAARECALPDDLELCSYFSLEDLWESYRE